MDVVLDTNVIHEDFLLRSADFRNLMDYLEKTDSNIMMPKIVLLEIEKKYAEELQKRFSKYNSHKNSLNDFLLDKEVSGGSVDINAEVKKYIAFLTKKFRLNHKTIVNYKPEYMDDVVKRAIERKRPCSDAGEEFRDVLLWLTVLDILGKSKIHEKSIILISNDKKAFASEEGKLHPQLESELSLKKLNVNYYCSIKDFVRGHASKIDFITKEWLASEVATLDGDIERWFERHEEQIIDRVERICDASITSSVDSLNIDVEIGEFYVYERSDGTCSVDLEIYGCLNVQIEVPIGLYDVDDDDVFKTKIKDFDFDFTASFNIEIEDAEVADSELYDMDF